MRLTVRRIFRTLAYPLIRLTVRHIFQKGAEAYENAPQAHKRMDE